MALELAKTKILNALSVVTDCYFIKNSLKSLVIFFLFLFKSSTESTLFLNKFGKKRKESADVLKPIGLRFSVICSIKFYESMKF